MKATEVAVSLSTNRRLQANVKASGEFSRRGQAWRLGGDFAGQRELPSSEGRSEGSE